MLRGLLEGLCPFRIPSQSQQHLPEIKVRESIPRHFRENRLGLGVFPQQVQGKPGAQQLPFPLFTRFDLLQKEVGALPQLDALAVDQRLFELPDLIRPERPRPLQEIVDVNDFFRAGNHREIPSRPNRRTPAAVTV